MTPSHLPTLTRYETSAAGLATLTLDSPHNRNALSGRLLSELHDALGRAGSDPAVRAVVLTATGTVFCSGADLKEAAAGNRPSGPGLAEVLTAITDLSKPVVARVNGRARAGGLGLIAACDLAVAPRSADFAFSEVRIGVVPAVIAAVCLPLLDRRSAQELFLTGAVFDAERAAAAGLLTASVDDDALDGAVADHVGQLLRGAPGALAATKILLDGPAVRTSAADRTQLLTDLARLSKRHFASPEAREGIAAFRERRSPNWVTAPAVPTDRKEHR